MKYLGILLLCYSFTITQTYIIAQDVNTDSLFIEAKKSVKVNDYSNAYRLLTNILNKKEDGDVRFYLGLLYSWDGKYVDARRELNKVQEDRPQSEEVITARINVEMWSDNPQNALTIIEKALTYKTGDESLLYKKAQALDKLKKTDDAIVILDNLLLKNPTNNEALIFRTKLRTKNMKNRLSINYVNEFVQNQSTWYSGNIQYSRKTQIGSVIGRINYARRFGLEGFQYEVDAYPNTGKTNYTYLNIGYSDAPVFPKYRLGFEFFQSLPKSFEASLGFRYMRFGTSNIIVYTGSVGKYLGNYWFSVRPFVTPSPGLTPSITGLFIVRRYFSDAENYIGIQYGHGSSPDDIHVYLAKTERLQSDKIKITYNQRLFDFWFLGISGSYEREEIYPEPPTFRDRYSIDITLQRIF